MEMSPKSIRILIGVIIAMWVIAGVAFVWQNNVKKTPTVGLQKNTAKTLEKEKEALIRDDTNDSDVPKEVKANHKFNPELDEVLPDDSAEAKDAIEEDPEAEKL